jgi:hypothetical protein
MNTNFKLTLIGLERGATVRVPRRTDGLRHVWRMVRATAVLTALIALATTAAQAASGPYYVTGTGSNGLTERAAPSPSATIVGHLANGATVYINCQTSGGSYATGGTPSTDSIWDQLTNGAYVADWWTTTPAVGTFSPGIPQCNTSPPPVAKFLNGQSARCLDAATQNIATNGTTIQLYDCLGGTNQNWLLYPDGTIRNAQSRRCLDAATQTIGINGGVVKLWDCTGGANQKWTIEADGTIRNQQSGRCLDADMGTIGTNGTKVHLWDCWGGRNQNWIRFSPSATTPPSICRAYTYKLADNLFSWSTLQVTFGISARFCYNGTSAHVVGSKVKPICNNPVQVSPACDTTSVVAPSLPGNSVNITFNIESSMCTGLWENKDYRNATAYISVDKNGNPDWTASPGDPIWYSGGLCAP